MVSNQVLDWQHKDGLTSEMKHINHFIKILKEKRQMVAQHHDKHRRDILQKLISIPHLETKTGTKIFLLTTSLLLFNIAWEVLGNTTQQEKEIKLKNKICFLTDCINMYAENSRKSEGKLLKI